MPASPAHSFSVSYVFSLNAMMTGRMLCASIAVMLSVSPILHFLFEAAWSNGRLFREYTVLLDPPLYDPSARRQPVSTAPDTILDDDLDLAEPEDVVADDPAAVAMPTGDSEYGPTDSSDTLWSIASKTRPDPAISVQQMMLALFMANPDAFTRDNINALKKGRILKIPAGDALQALSVAEAISQVRNQNALWQEVTGYAPDEPPARVQSTTEPDRGRVDETLGIGEVVSDGSELRLLAPTEDAVDSGAAQGAGSAGAADPQSLTLANEAIETLSQENTELKDRLNEAETIINDLKRLLELKDDELAAMQTQLMTEPEAMEGPAEESADVMEDTQMDEPVADESDVMEDEATEVAPQDPKQEDEGRVDEEEGVMADETAIDEAQPAPPPVVPVAPQTSMVDQIMGMVMENLIMIAAILGGGIVLSVVGVLVVRRKRAGANETAAATIADFPDFFDITDEKTSAMGAGAQATSADAMEAAGEDVTQSMAAAESEPEPEEDPLAEVNVFLAYEHFDQAEEFVRDAIEGEPDNLAFHLKLLEVFYAASNRRSYEAAARVLHNKVDGAGAEWDMAVTMWNDMSPHRALFEEGADEDGADDPPENSAGGGIVDLTAEDPAAGDDGGLDFDIGGAEEVAPAEDIALDLPSDLGDDVLDITATADDAGNEDLLDVTASVGLEEPAESAPAADENIMDFTAGVADENILDITGGEEAGEEDPLDMSAGMTDEGLLDVTAHGDLENEEDLLDATSAGLDSGAPAEGGTADEGGLDFYIDGMGTEESADGSLEMDTGEAVGGDDGFSLELDVGDDTGGELAVDEAAADEGLAFDLSLDDNTAEASGGDLSADFDLTIEADEPASDGESSLGIEIDMGDDAVPEIDMDGTVQIPAMGIELDDEDDDDPVTVFVPRSSEPEEQSEEDEVSTKLDLAKAYVELGDEDSAKPILDEILAQGNAAQQKQAEQLMGQI